MEPGKPAIAMMIVEDDGDSRNIMLLVLGKKFPGLTISSAANGRAGVEKFREQMQDIVITDVNMPEMSGLEMVKILREIKPETKIIIITADTGKAALSEPAGKAIHADHYVSKPVDFKKLFTAVESCISELTAL